MLQWENLQPAQLIEQQCLLRHDLAQLAVLDPPWIVGIQKGYLGFGTWFLPLKWRNWGILVEDQGWAPGCGIQVVATQSQPPSKTVNEFQMPLWVGGTSVPLCTRSCLIYIVEGALEDGCWLWFFIVFCNTVPVHGMAVVGMQLRWIWHHEKGSKWTSKLPGV